VFASKPRAASNSAKPRAAFMGPMVCELDGPMPILKYRKTLQTHARKPFQTRWPHMNTPLQQTAPSTPRRGHKC